MGGIRTDLAGRASSPAFTPLEKLLAPVSTAPIASPRIPCLKAWYSAPVPPTPCCADSLPLEPVDALESELTAFIRHREASRLRRLIAQLQTDIWTSPVSSARSSPCAKAWPPRPTATPLSWTRGARSNQPPLRRSPGPQSRSLCHPPLRRWPAPRAAARIIATTTRSATTRTSSATPSSAATTLSSSKNGSRALLGYFSSGGVILATIAWNASQLPSISSAFSVVIIPGG